MTHAQLVFVLSSLPSYERAQVAAAFGADWTPDGVARELLAGHFPRYLLQDHGIPWAAGGLFPLGDGTWDAWIFATRQARTRAHMRTLSKVCRAAVAWAFAHGARRVQACHVADQPRVHRWLESLGLKRARELTRFGANGETFLLFEVNA